MNISELGVMKMIDAIDAWQLLSRTFTSILTSGVIIVAKERLLLRLIGIFCRLCFFNWSLLRYPTI